MHVRSSTYVIIHNSHDYAFYFMSQCQRDFFNNKKTEEKKNRQLHLFACIPLKLHFPIGCMWIAAPVYTNYTFTLEYESHTPRQSTVALYFSGWFFSLHFSFWHNLCVFLILFVVHVFLLVCVLHQKTQHVKYSRSFVYFVLYHFLSLKTCAKHETKTWRVSRCEGEELSHNAHDIKIYIDENTTFRNEVWVISMKSGNVFKTFS